MEQVLLHKILTISPLADAGLDTGATYAGRWMLVQRMQDAGRGMPMQGMLGRWVPVQRMQGWVPV